MFVNLFFQVGLIPKNYVQELHEVVDSRGSSRSRESSQPRQLPPSGSSHPPPPQTNGSGGHGAENSHLSQVLFQSIKTDENFVEYLSYFFLW